MTLLGGYQKRYVRVNATADGANTLITGVAGKRIAVISYVLSNSTTAGIVTLQDSAGSPAVLASFDFALRGGAAYVGSESCPAFEVASGLSLVASNATGVDTLGHITYVLI